MDMKHFILALIFFFVQVSFGQSFVEKQNDTNPSFFKNGGFENMIAGWTVATGTRTYPKTSGNKISGQGFKLAFTSINGTLLSQTYSDCADLAGKNMVAGIHIKTPSTTIEVCSQVNGADYQCVAVPSGGSTLQWVPATFVAGASTCGMRVKTTGSTTSDITVDAAKLEENTGVGTAAQAEAIIAAGRITSAQNITTTAATTIILNGELKDVYGEHDTTTGLSTMKKAGAILVAWRVNFSNQSAERFIPGVLKNGVGACSNGLNIGTGSTQTLAASCLLDVVAGDTIGLFTASTADTNYDISASNTHMDIYRFPTAAEQVTRPNNSADLMGTIFYEESGTCPTNSIKVDGSTLNATTHAALIARRTAKGIASPTVLPNLSGLFIRSAGTQTQGGVAHTAGALGAFQADQMQGHRHDITASGTTVGTANLTHLGTVAGAFGAQTGGPLVFGSDGTPRTGTTTRPANMAFTPCMWFVSNPAPLIAGGYSSGNSGAQVMESATITCDATSSVSNSSSNWVTLGNASSNICALTFTGFSGTPKCFLGNKSSTSNSIVNVKIYSITQTGANFTCTSAITGSSAISAFTPCATDIICVGPK